jgi:hypothetical protein
MSGISVTRRTHESFAVRRAGPRLVALQDAALTRSVALLGMRLALAWIFMFHGAGKLLNFKHQGGIAGTTAFFQMEGLPAPHLMAYLVGLTEFGGGLLLLIGFAVPLAADAAEGAAGRHRRRRLRDQPRAADAHACPGSARSRMVQPRLRAGLERQARKSRLSGRPV